MNTQKWLDEYFKWLKNNYDINELENASEIVTPFSNFIGDRIRLYLEPIGSKHFRLTDDGNTFNDLEMMGIDLKNKTRQKTINQIQKMFNTELDSDNVLYVEGKNQDFAVSKQSLIQSVLRIDDLMMTKKSSVISIFNQEVQQFFDENDFGGVSNIPIQGATGNNYHFDYVLGKKKRRPEQLFQFINRPGFDRIAAEGVTFQDIKPNREEEIQGKTKLVIIFNDSEANVSNKSQAIADKYELALQPWSAREDLLKLK